MNVEVEAVRWRHHAPALLDLIPPSFVRLLADDVLADFREQRQSDLGHMPSAIARMIRPGLAVIHCLGAQAFHVDPEVCRFSHLLILRSRHWRIEGRRQPFDAFVADRPGDLICLDVHHPHALRAREHDAPEDLADLIAYDRVHTRVWCAVILESWAALTPAQAEDGLRIALTTTYDEVSSRLEAA